MRIADNEAVRKIYRTSKYVFFPILILLFAMVKANKGISLSDATYSLGNYRFFSEGEGVWFKLTFVSNLLGSLFIHLPYGSSMLGMNLYTSALTGFFGVLSYRFFMTKMPSWLAFLAELAVIGFCWAPSAILYHYLTYGLFMLAAMFLFRGLAGERPVCLVVAGIILGINTFVRFPNNILECLLIIPLIYYGNIKHKEVGKIVKEIILCVAGFLSAFLIMLILISSFYGSSSFLDMINGVIGISSSASDYTLASMILSIISAYIHGMKWGLYMVLAALMGVPFFLLYDGKYMKARKCIYCLCIVFLFFVLYKFGMYNFKYYQKESALQWGVVFLLISIGIDIWMVFTRSINSDWKLLGMISLIMILITPLGSNNYVWPILNSMFIICPVTVWIVYKFARWGRKYLDHSRKVPLFGIKSMGVAIILVFFLQAMGIGCSYVFLDGEGGESVSYEVSDNKVLVGMHTNKDNAEALCSLSSFMMKNEEKYKDKDLILYGNIPGLTYILDKKTALNSSWSDLDSNPVEDMKKSICEVDAEDIQRRPLVIISRELFEQPDNSIKLNLINNYIDSNDYVNVFANDKFVVFE